MSDIFRHDAALRRMKLRTVKSITRTNLLLGAYYPPEEERHPTGLVFSNARFVSVYQICMDCKHQITVVDTGFTKPTEGTMAPCPVCGPGDARLELVHSR